MAPMPPDPLPRSLDHPLPAGMRDLLPEEAAARRSLARQMLDRFALHGYALVTLPGFEVAALRPDMTPQIARMIATRLRERPQPLRIAYEGTVVRRRSGRARKHRQIPQVGVELAGMTGPAGDIELLALAVEALQA